MTTDYESKRWEALALLCIAQFMVVLDASIVNIALPTIGDALDFSQDDLSWVVNAYVLTFGGFLLLGGRLADLLGRRRVFMAGLILFALASLAGGFAQNDVQLVIARAVQGLGAAIVSPAALSIITVTFREGAERNKALGAWGAVAGSGGAVGVLLGGVLTEGLGWEWVLWVNVPIGLAAAATVDYVTGPRHAPLPAPGKAAVVDYFADQTPEGPGRWLGDGPRRFGLTGPVERDALEALLRGDDPRSGAPLLSTQGSNRRANTARTACPRHAGAAR